MHNSTKRAKDTKRLVGKQIGTILILFLGISLTMYSSGYAKSQLSKESIPDNIPDDIRSEIEKLYSPSTAERIYAAIALGKKGAPATAAIPYLIGMLDEYSTLGIGAFEIETPATSEEKAIKKLVKWGKICPGKEAANALVGIGKPSVKPLIKALKKAGFFARRMIALALGKLGDKRAVEPLIKALRDEDPLVRESSAKSLGQIGDRQVLKPLIASLGDGVAAVRWEIALALGNLKDYSAIEPLKKQLEKDPDYDVRKQIRKSLKRFGKKGKY